MAMGAHTRRMQNPWNTGQNKNKSKKKRKKKKKTTILSVSLNSTNVIYIISFLNAISDMEIHAVYENPKQPPCRLAFTSTVFFLFLLNSLSSILLHKMLSRRLFLGTGGGETNVTLERVVKEPLETGEGTDHDNTDGETVPETTETNLGVDTADGLAGGLTGLLLSVDLGDHDISRVGDNGTEDTGNVTTEEGDTGLGKEGVLLLGLGELSVDELDSLLEGGELNHGVRNLAGPEGRETLVKGTEALSGSDLLVTVKDRGGEGGDGGLGLDLNGLPGAEKDVGNQLSRSGGSKVKNSSVLVGSLLTNNVGVLLLEELVETVLTGTLERVTNKSGTETGEDTTGTLSGDDGLPGLEVTGVKAGVNLSAALDEIEGGDSSVGSTAS